MQVIEKSDYEKFLVLAENLVYEDNVVNVENREALVSNCSSHRR